VPGKRYVLLRSESTLEEVAQDLIVFLQGRIGAVKLMEIEGEVHFTIVKTDVLGASALKDLRPGFAIGRHWVIPILTSGAVGNLKRRAKGARANGKVHER
jgi:hypothetical protein